ncbi:MAG: GNAT family N-acyltransferase [Planctomycetota bacterium]
MNSTANLAAPLRRARLLPGQGLVPPLDVTVGKYRLRFARDEADLEAVQRLRYRVFNVELGEGLDGAHQTGLDADAFDAQCQHLIVALSHSGEVIGTYRMQTAASARAGRGWYSSTEFDLSALPSEFLAGAVELGRACIAADHRDRNVLFLLFRGLIAYVEHNRAQRFFGCSSLTGTDPRAGAALYRRLLAEGRVHPSLVVRALPRHACAGLELEDDAHGPEVEVPKLFGVYLRHGGTILGTPAIDHEFGTIDFLTLVENTPELRARFAGRT